MLVWIYKRGNVPQHAVAAEKPNTALIKQISKCLTSQLSESEQLSGRPFSSPHFAIFGKLAKASEAVWFGP